MAFIKANEVDCGCMMVVVLELNIHPIDDLQILVGSQHEEMSLR